MAEKFTLEIAKLLQTYADSQTEHDAVLARKVDGTFNKIQEDDFRKVSMDASDCTSFEDSGSICSDCSTVASVNGSPKPKSRSLKEAVAAQPLPPPPPPPPPMSGMVLAPSRGSKNHAALQCRPCKNFNSPDGCPNGVLCNFCHYQHDESKLLEANRFSAHASQRRAQKKATQQKEKYNFCTSDVAFQSPYPWYAMAPETWIRHPPGLTPLSGTTQDRIQ